MTDPDCNDADTIPGTRADWPRWLTAVPAVEVRAIAQALEAGLEVEELEPPQSGLGLLQLRDSALSDAYFLGEIPVTRVHLRVRAPDGRSTEGGVHLMDDRLQLAHDVALCDAVLAGQLPGWERLRDVLETGREGVEATEQGRRAMRERTRVDFSLLGMTEEDDDE